LIAQIYFFSLSYNYKEKNAEDKFKSIILG